MCEIFSSVGAGLDYQHSFANFAYSWMHYALFEHAIAAQKYQNIEKQSQRI